MYFLCRRPHGVFTIFSQTSTLMLLCSTRNSWFGKIYRPNIFKNPKTKPRKIHKNPKTFPQSSPYGPKRKKSKITRKDRVKAFLDEPDLEKVVDMFKECSEFIWFRNNKHVYNVVTRRLFTKRELPLIEEILERQKKTTCIVKEGFCMRLIRLYGESGMFSQAQKLFDEMPQLNSTRTVKSLNTLMGAAIDSVKIPEVLDLFQNTFSDLKITPNLVSYNILFQAQGRLGLLDDMIRKIFEMERIAVKPDSICFCTILWAFYSNGRFEDGDKVWKLMEDRCILPSLGCFNAKLSGLMMKNRMAAAVELYKAILNERLMPDVFTFNSLIRGFCDGGDSEQAKKWYNEMKIKACSPNKATYHILIPFACRIGDLEWGLELCNDGFSFKCGFRAWVLQNLVESLAEKSKVKEAKWVVELFKQSGYPYYFVPKLRLEE